MTFPELPKGYRWQVRRLIPTAKTAGEFQVNIYIRRTNWFLNLLDAVRYEYTGGEIYRWVQNANDETVKAAAESLYESFWAQWEHPSEAQGWENALNFGTMK